MSTATITALKDEEMGFTCRFKELILLFFPILATTLSTCLIPFVERLFLSRLSIQTMEVAVSATYAYQIFQVPCIALAMMAQVCIGRWKGAQEWNLIGPGVWQFIWFSCLSIVVTFPLGLIYGKFYFTGAEIEELAWPYYLFFISINFLYPLATALSSFYLGRGKTRLVVGATFGSQIGQLMLSYLLIFGYSDWIPSLGLMGAAISTLFAKGGLCLLLLCGFLSSRHAEGYRSRDWRLQPKLFWECIRPGLLRAMHRVLLLTAWVSVTQLIIVKGSEYVLLLSIGGALFSFCTCFSEAICQAQTIVVSSILGAKNYHLIKNTFQSVFFLAFIIISAMALPVFLFPYEIFHYLFSGIVLSEVVIDKLLLGVWLAVAFHLLGFVVQSYILAFKDIAFLLFVGAFTWVSGFLLTYFAVEMAHISADQFWMTVGLTNSIGFLLLAWRTKWQVSNKSKHLHLSTS